jgi:hypothetical protein
MASAARAALGYGSHKPLGDLLPYSGSCTARSDPGFQELTIAGCPATVSSSLITAARRRVRAPLFRRTDKCDSAPMRACARLEL